MTTPPFTKVVYGRMQRLSHQKGEKRVLLWWRRLHRASSILNCNDAHFERRWASVLSSNELQAAREHRSDFDLWLDANLIIAERMQRLESLL